MSLEDMDRFEEMKKTKPIKNTWYDWLINHIRQAIRKSVNHLKSKFISSFKATALKETVYGREQKLSKPRKNIRKPFLS